jgi:hypothetical protein
MNSEGQADVPPGLANVVGLAAGDAYSMALRGDGSVVIWGSPGAVADLPPGLEGVQAILASRRVAFAILGEGLPRLFATPINPALEAGVFTVLIDAERGSAHRLEYTDALPGGAWMLGAPVHSENAQATLRDSAATAPARFYQVRRLR